MPNKVQPGTKLKKGVQMLDCSGVESGVAFCKAVCKQITGKVNILKDNDDINTQSKLLVVCYNYSRVETDIDSAVSRLSEFLDKQRVAIVVMHVTEKYALPHTMPTKNLEGDRYSDYGLMVDFFYTQDEKIYKCDLNSQAKQELNTFLKQLHCGRRDFIDNRGKNMGCKIYPEKIDTIEQGFRVQILERSDIESVRTFCKELVKELPCGMIMLNGTSSINKVLPLILVCFNHSRMGTDIDAALKGLCDVINKEKTAIVVMHVMEKHALPQIMPTKTLTNVRYGEYGLLVDFFYTHNEKIYKCDLNSKATDELNEFLKKHTVEHESPIEQTCTKAALKSCIGQYTFMEVFLVVLAITVLSTFAGIMYYVSTL